LNESDLDALTEAVRLEGLERGFSWTPAEARAIAEQLRSTRDALESARRAFAEDGWEPATAFEAVR
jgi:hypothetical protein